MESTGIMQKIKILLEEGNHSGELIKMGFAPGTVYKVQRQFRRKTYMAQTEAGNESRATPMTKGMPSVEADVNDLIDRLRLSTPAAFLIVRQMAVLLLAM